LALSLTTGNRVLATGYCPFPVTEVYDLLVLRGSAQSRYIE
jgi:hypothetical protein